MPVEEKAATSPAQGAAPAASGKDAGKNTGKDAGTKGRGKKAGKKHLVIVLVVVLAVAAGAYTMLKPKAAAGPPEPGAIVQLDPVTVNLADGHYLRVGIALQFVKGAVSTGEGATPPDTAPALDQTITALTGRDAAGFETAKGIEGVRTELKTRIAKVYDGKVMEVLFTQFVIQ